MGDPVENNFSRCRLCPMNRVLLRVAVQEYVQLRHLGNPTAIDFPVKLDRELHSHSVPLLVGSRGVRAAREAAFVADQNGVAVARRVSVESACAQSPPFIQKPIREFGSIWPISRTMHPYGDKSERITGMGKGYPFGPDPAGKEMMQTITKSTTAIYWHADGRPVLHNGSMFFVNTGRALFGVTARHVYEEYLECADAEPTICQVGNLVVYSGPQISDQAIS